MNIILEGHDNAGKSTLAHAIGRRIGRPVKPSEGPEQYPGELEERVARYNNYTPHIFDRHPCVSDPIYSIARGVPTRLSMDTIEKFYATPALFIYCDPLNRGMGGHVGKDHDSPEHMAAVFSHYQSLLAKYRQWATDHAHIIYRIGDDPERVIDMVVTHLERTNVFDPVRDVRDFMSKFGQAYEGQPRALPRDLGQFREDFMREELDEYLKHSRRLDAILQEIPIDQVEVTHELSHLLDATVDKMYVDIGTALLHGFNFREAWRRVHSANMKKERVARASDSTRYSAWDVRKPEGWTAPDHKDLVENHIHK